MDSKHQGRHPAAINNCAASLPRSAPGPLNEDIPALLPTGGLPSSKALPSRDPPRPPAKLIPVDALRQLKSAEPHAAGFATGAGHGGLILVWRADPGGMPFALGGCGFRPCCCWAGSGLCFCAMARMRPIAPPSATVASMTRGLVGRGALLFNADFYRRYNQWQINTRYNPPAPAGIPELEGGHPPAPAGLWALSSSGRPGGWANCAPTGAGWWPPTTKLPLIPADAVALLRASHWKQAAVNARALLLSLAGRQRPAALGFWLLALPWGNPWCASCCSLSTVLQQQPPDGLRNTPALTHTRRRCRWLMWNMPFPQRTPICRARSPSMPCPRHTPDRRDSGALNGSGLPGGANRTFSLADPSNTGRCQRHERGKPSGSRQRCAV